MRKSTTPLKPAQVYRFAVDFCQAHLDLKPAGKVTATILLTVGFAAAARRKIRMNSDSAAISDGKHTIKIPARESEQEN